MQLTKNCYYIRFNSLKFSLNETNNIQSIYMKKIIKKSKIEFDIFLK